MRDGNARRRAALMLPAMSAKLKRRLTILLSVGAGAAVLWAILRWVGWRRVLHEIANLGSWGFTLFFLNAGLIFLLWVLTWRILLRSYGVERNWREILGALAGGYAISYITPSANFGGEPVRVYLISEGFSSSTAEATSSVIVERFLNMISTLLLVFIGSLCGFFSDYLPQGLRWGLFGWAVAGMGFNGWAVFCFARRCPWMSRTLRGLARLIPWRGYLERAARWFSKVEEEIEEAFSPQRWRGTLQAFVPSFISTVLVYLNPLIFLYFTTGAPPSLLELSLIFALMMFLNTVLWITPGGLGIVDGGLIGIFGLLGLGKESAVAFSFTLKLAELSFVSFGLIYITLRGTTHLIHRGVERRVLG